MEMITGTVRGTTAPKEIAVEADGSVNLVDQPIALAKAGNVDCTSAHILTDQVGVGYITVTNLDASAVVYLGISTVTGSTNGEALPAGASRSWRSSNLAIEYGIGSATVNVSVRR